MMSRTLAIAAATSILTAPAFAGGLAFPDPDPVVAPVPAPAPLAPVGVDWTGPYIGGQIGFGHATAEGDVGTFSFEENAEGAIGGVTAGYDHDFGRFVLGAEAQYDVSNIEFDDGSSINSIGRLKARAGFEAGRALVYATGGVAQAHVESAGDEFSDTGWVAGAGMDYMVTDRVAVGGEVLHHEFSDFDDSGLDLNATTAQAKVTYRF